MKFTRFLSTLSLFLAIVVTSCQDNNKQNETEVNEEVDAQSFEERQDQMTNDVKTTVKGNPSLSTFALRMDAAEIDLNADSTYTIFVPNNNAYSYLYREHGENVLEDVNRQEEINFLIAEGEITIDSLRSGIQENNGTFTIPTRQGEHLLVSMRNDSIFVRGRAGNGANILESDIDAENGVVHIISGVILPGDIQTHVELQGNQSEQNQNQQNRNQQNQ